MDPLQSASFLQQIESSATSVELALETIEKMTKI